MKNHAAADNRHFDEWAPGYESSIAQAIFFDPIHRRMLRLLLKANVAAPSRILDVGCGTGRLLRAVAGMWPGAQLTGVDLSEPMIEAGKKLAPDIRFHIAPAEKLPLEDQTFDIVLSSLTLHHWNNAEQGVHEIARVIRPGGLFCLADHLGPKWAVRFFESGAKSNREMNKIFETEGFETVSGSWYFGWVGIRLVKKNG